VVVGLRDWDWKGDCMIWTNLKGDLSGIRIKVERVWVLCRKPLRTMKMRYYAMYIESSQHVLFSPTIRVRRDHTNFQRLILQRQFCSEDSNPRLRWHCILLTLLSQGYISIMSSVAVWSGQWQTGVLCGKRSGSGMNKGFTWAG
jgi:hypothetical protein